tara:strand:+ start:728 stop:1111 length:384 start_codon:yes stop_codon:yes gene_type:complete
MKNLIIITLLCTGLMSCSVIENFLGGAEGEALSFGGIIDSIWTMLTAFIPSLAAWEGAGSIFSPRKRQHYTNMVTAIIPMNKNMEFGDAIKSLGSGLGLAHSSDATKSANDEEVTAAKVEAVTTKKA